MERILLHYLLFYNSMSMRKYLFLRLHLEILMVLPSVRSVPYANNSPIAQSSIIFYHFYSGLNNLEILLMNFLSAGNVEILTANSLSFSTS